MRLRTIRKVKEEERREEVGWVACKTRGEEGRRGGGEEGRREGGEEGRRGRDALPDVLCLLFS